MQVDANELAHEPLNILSFHDRLQCEAAHSYAWSRRSEFLPHKYSALRPAGFTHQGEKNKPRRGSGGAFPPEGNLLRAPPRLLERYFVGEFLDVGVALG
jgi:hypothetical protein